MDQLMLPVVAIRPHPLRSARAVYAARPGDDLLAALLAAPGGAALAEYSGTRVWVNDLLVQREQWGVIILQPGDIVSVVVVPQTGGDANKVLRTVGMLGLLALAILVPPALGLTGPAAGLLGAGIMFGGTLLLNALVPPQNPSINESDYSRKGPGYSITGARNTAEPYGPVGRVYGRHRIYPKFAAMPYTEVRNNDQFLRCLFLIGKGRYNLSAHKIGDTAIGSYEDAEYEVYYTGETDNHYSLFPRTVTEDDFSIELTQAGGYQTRSTEADIDEIGIDLTFPTGLATAISTG
jgi:hypothetical protein